MDITIGTDPECFLIDQSGTYFSGHDLIKGTKARPYPVKNGAIQVDGVALEFNTAPARTKEEFTQYISDVLSSLTAEYSKIRPDLTIAMTPTATFSREYFDTLPESAVELGCTPDFNAYTGKENDPPSTTEPFRTGAGHIHVGWTKYANPHDDEHFETSRGLVRQLDTVLYPASLLWDSDDKRRTLYGKIGAFRPKSYGVEYRPLSNAYLADKRIQEFVFETTKKASEDFFNGILYYDFEFAQNFISLIQSGEGITREQVGSYLTQVQNKFGVPEYGA